MKSTATRRGAIVTSEAVIERVEARAYRIPTARTESDGTFRWDATTLVVVHVHAGGMRGFGYSYGSAAMVPLVVELAPHIQRTDAFATERAFERLVAAVRNIGRPGIASTAISAIDCALWDLKAKLLGVSLHHLLGGARDAVAVYGSGGFTTESVDELATGLAAYTAQGITRVKMKVGTHPRDDVARVQTAREILGPRTELMVDANGAYTRKQALAHAERFAQLGVAWFEEPVSSDDLEGLRLLRDRAPATLDIAAGEYGFDTLYFRRMLEAGAVDVLQLDATRCLGVTGFNAAVRLAEAYLIPTSTHTAPTLHAPLACATTHVMHAEYFYDHVRIESMLFDGFRAAINGKLTPDPGRPGLGVELKTADAERFLL